MDEHDEAAAREFVSRFDQTRDALRTELTFAGELATLRRVLDHGTPLERGGLLVVLGHAKHVVMRLGAPGAADSEAARAAGERATRFLRGLVGDLEPVGKATLRPALDVIGGDALVISAESGEMRSFTAEVAKTLFSDAARGEAALQNRTGP